MIFFFGSWSNVCTFRNILNSLLLCLICKKVITIDKEFDFTIVKCSGEIFYLAHLNCIICFANQIMLNLRDLLGLQQDVTDEVD